MLGNGLEALLCLKDFILSYFVLVDRIASEIEFILFFKSKLEMNLDLNV